MTLSNNTIQRADTNFSVAVYGAGTIGSHLAYTLDKVGVRVTFIAHGETKKDLETKGLRITFPNGSTTSIPMDVTDEPGSIGEVDYVFLTEEPAVCKASKIPVSLEPLLGPKTVVVPAPDTLPANFFHKEARGEDAISEMLATVEPSRLIGFASCISAMCPTPGAVTVKDLQGGYMLGELAAPTLKGESQRVVRLSRALQAGGVSAPVVDDIRSQVWTKKLNDLAFSIVSVLGNASSDQICESAAAMDTVRALLAEGDAVREALSLPSGGTMDDRVASLRGLHAKNASGVEQLYASFKNLSVLSGVDMPTLETLFSMVQMRQNASVGAKRKALTEPEEGRTVKRILTPASEVKERIHASARAKETVAKGREAIRDVLDGKDDRVVCIVGPCSIHDPTAALEYLQKLVVAAEEHKEDIVTVMRVYFEKPRTTVGWKGLINDPNLDGSCDIEKGLLEARKLLMAVADAGMPASTEFLDMVSPNYISDLISWGAIGARTTESQSHREMSSGLGMPIGFKNGTSGDSQVAVDAIGAARGSHNFMSVCDDGKAAQCVSSGNNYGHLILRGGKDGPNFDAKSVADAVAVMAKAKLPAQVVVDVSHANSCKNHKNQLPNIENISQQIADGCEAIKGVMIESNLVEGAQKLAPGKTDPATLTYGQSVTDACVSWEETEACMAALSRAVKARRAAKTAQ